MIHSSADNTLAWSVHGRSSHHPFHGGVPLSHLPWGTHLWFLKTLLVGDFFPSSSRKGRNSESCNRSSSCSQQCSVGMSNLWELCPSTSVSLKAGWTAASDLDPSVTPNPELLIKSPSSELLLWPRSPHAPELSSEQLEGSPSILLMNDCTNFVWVSSIFLRKQSKPSIKAATVPLLASSSVQ